MWAIASTMTGDDAAAFDPGDEAAEATSDEPVPVEVVREVMRRTLPAWRRHRHRTSRLDIVITTTEAAALRVFSPSARPVRGGAHAAPLDPQAAALRRAFSRRLSWDVQAHLWATEVENIPESDVARRLEQFNPDKEAADVALRLSYLDIRKGLNAECRAALRSVFGSLGPEPSSWVTHVRGCAFCQGEVTWLKDLGSALGRLPSPMPAVVWDEARRVGLDDLGRSSASLPQEDAYEQQNLTPSSGQVSSISSPPSMEASPEAAHVDLSGGGNEERTSDDLTTGMNGQQPAQPCRTVEAEDLGSDRQVLPSCGEAAASPEVTFPPPTLLPLRVFREG